MSKPPTLHSRSARDGDGTLWQITESDAREVPGARSDTCLVFDSQAVCRRYWSYPANWRTLSEDELLDFMSRSRQSHC